MWQNIWTTVLTYESYEERSIQKVKVRILTNNWSIIELYCTATITLSKKFSESCWKSSEKLWNIIVKVHFCKNQTKALLLKFYKFGEFSINFRQTVGDSYLNKYPTILVPHFPQVCLSKTDKDLMVTDFEVKHALSALDRLRINQSHCEFVAIQKEIVLVSNQLC